MCADCFAFFMLCCCKAFSTASPMSGLHQTGEHERERKRAKKVNKQREKDKRGGTANNWPSTFQFAHST